MSSTVTLTVEDFDRGLKQARSQTIDDCVKVVRAYLGPLVLTSEIISRLEALKTADATEER